ncbi:MAG: VWA-like domain-containing protein, partial [Campylobacterota bacterium]|nr:VWA-like domain-containing protein [Campylobacterota bacterium]
MLASFIDELEALLLSFNDVYIELLICDDRIRTHQSIQSGEPIKYQLIGAGGTSFIPVFEYIENADFTCNLLLYFTDLEGNFPLKTPEYETFWVTSVAKEVPFGSCIEMSIETST